MPDPLMRELAHHEYLRVQLGEQFPDVDEETLADTVEGMTDLAEMLAAVVRSQLDDLALVSALRARAADMQQRLLRIEQRASKKKELLTSVMERAGLKRLTEPDFTVSLRQTQPPLILVDENEIPSEFWKPQPPKLDRQGLISALRLGRDISGATLGNGGLTISVRTK